MSRTWTTISCRAFAVGALLLACGATPARAADKPPPPRLPLAAFWSIDLGGEPSAPPASDGDRVFLALKSAHLTARSAIDGRELWRITKDVSVPMATEGTLLFVAAADAVEALRVADGGSAWIAPRIKPVVPLVSRAGWVIAVTETEIVAIRARDGEVAWRHPAGGVRLQPEIDGDHVFTGADDGRVLAQVLATGEVAWESFLTGGITSLAAGGGRVYSGAGDKQFHCLDGRSGKVRWTWRTGSVPIGRVAVDDDRVYFAALNNVVYGLDRLTGNQRWQTTINRRPLAGVIVLGHVVFVPVVAPQLLMFYDGNGKPSGAIDLPDEIPRDTPPDVRETATGLQLFVVTGGLANAWKLTFIARVDDVGVVRVGSLDALPGVPFLTDPVLEPIGKVLGLWILDDPPLLAPASIGWPLILLDPPLEPLTVIPGLQLRPLSPVLPIRRAG